MSHNKLKVANQSPNINSEVSVDINDLSDVNTSSASNGDLLQYASGDSTWSSASVSGASLQYIWAGGKADSYSNSPATSISANATLYVYDNAPVNTITGSTITSTSNWIESITLPVGKYVFRCQSMLVFSSTGYATYQVMAGSSFVTSYGVVGENRGVTFGPSGSLATGYYEVTSGTVVFNLELKNVSNVDSIANQGNTPGEYGLIYIEKVS